MRKALAILSAISLVFGMQINPASAAEIWQPNQEWSVDELGIALEETFGGEISFMASMTDRGPSKLPDQKLCKDGYGASPCNFASNGKGVWGAVLMPACTSAKEFNCIEDVKVWKLGEEPQSATFVRQVEGGTFPANSQRRLTKGSTVSIWDAPLSPHLGEATTYAAYVKLAINFGSGIFGYSDLHAALVPFVAKNKPGARAGYPSQQKNPAGYTEVSPGGQSSIECVFTEKDLCGGIQDFAPDTKASMRIRLSKDVVGWFKGRMKDPTIKISNYNNYANLVEVSASPVAVPKIDARMPKESITPALTKFYKNFHTEQGLSEWGPLSLLSDNPNVVDGLSLFRAAAKDSAAGYNSYWNFSTINLDDQKTYDCLKSTSRLQGIVTTNSMAYQGGVPTFSGGFLNYSVSGMHFEPDGKTPVLGTYDLIMRSDTARCLYGWGKTPLSATVSVTGGGDKTIATTVVSEKNGWLKLAAYGFTFSKKTIKVKISKKK